MIKDFFNSMSGNIRERAQSPLLSSYTIAMIACNWKPLVVLLTSKSTGVSLVKEVSSEFSSFLWSLGVPLIIAIVFSVLYPAAKAIIGTLNSRARIMEINVEARLEETKEEHRKWRESMREDKVEFILKSLEDIVIEDKLGYHDLKKILDILPNEEDLRAKPNK